MLPPRRMENLVKLYFSIGFTNEVMLYFLLHQHHTCKKKISIIIILQLSFPTTTTFCEESIKITSSFISQPHCTQSQCKTAMLHKPTAQAVCPPCSCCPSWKLRQTGRVASRRSSDQMWFISQKWFCVYLISPPHHHPHCLWSVVWFYHGAAAAEIPWRNFPEGLLKFLFNLIQIF